jgi:predicted  nucleic acid-binding Zn-ribbon protein
MIIGFWYANALIENRISRETNYGISVVRLMAFELHERILEIRKSVDQNKCNLENAKRSFMNLVRRFSDLSEEQFLVKMTLSSVSIALIEEILSISSRLFVESSHPIDEHAFSQLEDKIVKLKGEL